MLASARRDTDCNMAEPNGNVVPFDPEQPLDDLFIEAEVHARRRALRALLPELESRWRAGDLGAIHQAARELCVGQQAPPWWLVDAIAKLIERSLSNDEKEARRLFEIHQRRWEAVVEIRQRRHEFALRGDMRGMTWLRCYAAAAEVLEGTDAAGSLEAMKDSYQLIQKAGGAGATQKNYQRIVRERTRLRKNKSRY